MATHPLTRPASWPLKVGAASVPSIKWLGGALWVVAASLALVWLTGLIQDAFAGQLAAWVGAVGMLAVVAWFLLAWQVVRQWLTHADTLTLTWQGPVVAADPARRGREVSEGGFHVSEWQAAVQVRVVLDWQRWMLLRLRTGPAADAAQGAVREAFCWLAVPEPIDGVIERADNRAGALRALTAVSLHQLRSLLYLPPDWITQKGGQPSSSAGQTRHTSKLVASWAALAPSGSQLHPAATSLSRRQLRLAHRAADTLFPPTELLLDDMLADECKRERGAAQKGVA